MGLPGVISPLKVEFVYPTCNNWFWGPILQEQKSRNPCAQQKQPRIFQDFSHWEPLDYVAPWISFWCGMPGKVYGP